VSKLEKQTADLQATVGNSTLLNLQAKCAGDAKTWFRENWATVPNKDDLLLVYHNHYNKRLNRCFIEVEYHRSTGFERSWSNDVRLWDVYENSEIAVLHENHLIFAPKFEDSYTLVDCAVAQQKCKSMSDFVQLTQSYMSE